MCAFSPPDGSLVIHSVESDSDFNMIPKDQEQLIEATRQKLAAMQIMAISILKVMITFISYIVLHHIVLLAPTSPGSGTHFNTISSSWVVCNTFYAADATISFYRSTRHTLLLGTQRQCRMKLAQGFYSCPGRASNPRPLALWSNVVTTWPRAPTRI
jgi:hypothetical protein